MSNSPIMGRTVSGRPVSGSAFLDSAVSGSIVALVTPLTIDNAIDWPALEKLIDWHIKEGTNALVAVGTTGESATLSMAEHQEVIQQVVRWVNGRIPVIGGTGANSTQEAIELTQQAEQVGVDACLLVTPYYNKPTQEGLFQHYQEVAKASSVPLLLYNVPGRTAVDIQLETVLRLAELDSIVGIKDATGDVARGIELLAAVPQGFAVYSGDDFTAPELMFHGAMGNISVTANVLPRVMSHLCQLCRESEGHDQARALQKLLMPLHEVMFVESNPIPVKWALKVMGHIEAGIRLPLTTLSDSLRPSLENVLQQTQRLTQEWMAAGDVVV